MYLVVGLVIKFLPENLNTEESDSGQLMVLYHAFVHGNVIVFPYGKFFLKNSIV